MNIECVPIISNDHLKPIKHIVVLRASMTSSPIYKEKFIVV